nr:MAG TPA: hypothetical protein [Bacteriophage sp.]DAI69030.1 MAG TPA: hypothetical protein [Bacteriophage sp.]
MDNQTQRNLSSRGTLNDYNKGHYPLREEL